MILFYVDFGTNQAIVKWLKDWLPELTTNIYIYLHTFLNGISSIVDFSQMIEFWYYLVHRKDWGKYYACQILKFYISVKQVIWIL